MPDSELSPAREFTTHVPEISLPKSGGAIRSVGEKFSLNPATGSGTVSIPIAMAPSRGAPKLSLSYSSGAGNGPFGLGWSLNLGKITRKTDSRLPTYEDNDVFIVDGSEDLVQTDVVQDGPVRITTYQPRTEGGFSWIRQYETTEGSWWLTISADNIRRWYGAYPDEAGHVHSPDPQAQIIDPNHPSRVFTWLLSEERDDRGNCTKYAYRAEDVTGIDTPTTTERNRKHAQAQKYLIRIDYAKSPNTALGAPEFLFKIEFDYRRVETDADWTESVRSSVYE